MVDNVQTKLSVPASKNPDCPFIWIQAVIYSSESQVLSPKL